MTVQPDCADFQRRLEQVLAGRPPSAGLRPLAWHEHLLGCADCRALLEREEALEELLASLPEPGLSPELARRVLARLTVARDLDRLLELDLAEPPGGLGARVLERARAAAALDRLLDLDPAAPAPEGLAGRVARGARAAAALDRLLAQDAEPVPPPGLADRVLAGVHPARRPAARRLRLLRDLPRYAAAAAALLLALGAAWWALRPAGVPAPPVSDPEEVARTAEEPDPELLAALDVLIDDSVWEEDLAMDLDLLLAEEVEPEVEVLLAFLPEEDGR